MSVSATAASKRKNKRPTNTVNDKTISASVTSTTETARTRKTRKITKKITYIVVWTLTPYKLVYCCQ